MSKPILYFLIILVVSGAVVGGSLIYKRGQTNPTSQTSIFPIPLGNSLVQSASIYYRLVGKIKDIESSSSNSATLQLVSSTSESLPSPLALTSQTFVSRKGATPSATLKDLKSGDQVEIIYLFLFSSKTGLVTQIQIQNK